MRVTVGNQQFNFFGLTMAPKHYASVFRGKQFSRMPLLIAPDELDVLLSEVSERPRIKVLLKDSTRKV